MARLARVPVLVLCSLVSMAARGAETTDERLDRLEKKLQSVEGKLDKVLERLERGKPGEPPPPFAEPPRPPARKGEGWHKTTVLDTPLDWSDYPVPARPARGRTIRVPADAKTIRDAAARAEAGDTIVIKGGVYEERGISFKSSGTPENWIILKAAPGEEVILDGKKTGESPEAFRPVSADYIRVQDIKMRNYAETMYFTGGTYSHWDLIRLRIEAAEEGGILVKRCRRGSSDWLIHSCTFEANFEVAVALADLQKVTVVNCRSINNDDKLGQQGDADGFHAESSSDLTFVACQAINNSEDGFDLKADNCTIRNCRVSGNGNGLKLWGKNIVVENCAVWENDGTALIVTGDRTAVTPVVVRDSVIGSSPEGVLFSGSASENWLTLERVVLADVWYPFLSWKEVAPHIGGSGVLIAPARGSDVLYFNAGKRVYLRHGEIAKFQEIMKIRAGWAVADDPAALGFKDTAAQDFTVLDGSPAAKIGLKMVLKVANRH